PIYDEEPMTEVQLTAECNIFATRQQHTEQPEIINEENEHLNKENETVKKHYKDLNDSIKITRSKTIEQTTSLLANNPVLNAQIQEKCVFNANHDDCITKILKEVNSRAKIQSNKTRNSNKPVEQKSHTQKPVRKIFTGHRLSLNKTFVVYGKTYRSYLRWKPTGRIFKTVGLRWVPTGKILASCTSKDDSESTHGSNVDIPNIHKCKQTLDLSVGTSINVQKEQGFDLSAEFGNLFSHEYFNGENQVVLKSFAVTTADASDTRQQQLVSTSSTST
ncbi:hypothetical protein Tco_0625126, partial [Tanacetum coccineum]